MAGVEYTEALHYYARLASDLGLARLPQLDAISGYFRAFGVRKSLAGRERTFAKCV